MRASAWPLAVLLLAGCGGVAAPASQAAPSTAPAGSAAPSATQASSAPASAAAAASAAPAKASASANPAAAETGSKVTIVYATSSGETAPLWVAVDEGFFKKYGLDATVTHAQGTLAADALVSGNAQGGFMGGADAMTAMAAGTPLKILLVLQKENPYAIVVQPDIKTASDLKGKALAIGKLGDTSDVSAHIALSRFGLDPSKDVVERQIGNSPARFAALQSGQVAAAIEDQAFTDMLVKQGMHVLVSLAKDNVPYIANALVVNSKLIQGQPQIVEAMVHGAYDGAKYVLDPSHKQQVLAVIGKYQRADPNSPQLAKIYDSLVATEAKDPTPVAAGADTILKALRSMQPGRYAKLDAADTIYASFMQKLMKSSS